MSNAPPYVECPHCGFTFNDLAGHIRSAHPKPRTVLEPYDTVKPARMAKRVTAPVTDRTRGTIEHCMSVVDRLRTLTTEKRVLLDELYRWLQAEREKELHR